jgi:hypothetical protein
MSAHDLLWLWVAETFIAAVLRPQALSIEFTLTM